MELLPNAVSAALGWIGHTLPSIRVMGEFIDVVINPDYDQHRRRVATRQLPICDPLLLQCAVAQMDWLPAPFTVTGIVARRQSWDRARRTACSYAAVAARAAVIPQEKLRDPLAVHHADRLGIGLMTIGPDGELSVLMEPAAYRRPRTSFTLDLVNEVIYDAAIRLGAFADA